MLEVGFRGVGRMDSILTRRRRVNFYDNIEC